jgi:hypothetical protein
MKLPGEMNIDRENAFLLFATFCGDIERTAHALNVSAVIVLKMADEEGWTQKLGPILALKKSTRPGDIERAINRALNFVQAHRMRLIVERAIHLLTELSKEEFEAYVHSAKNVKDGVTTIKSLSTRSLADLATAMEKCQAMTYQALTDTAQDRHKRGDDGGDPASSAGTLHAQISAGLAAISDSATPRAKLFDAQLSQGQQLVKASEPKPVKHTASPPPHPNDNDNH